MTFDARRIASFLTQLGNVLWDKAKQVFNLVNARRLQANLGPLAQKVQSVLVSSQIYASAAAAGISDFSAYYQSRTNGTVVAAESGAMMTQNIKFVV